MGLAGQDICCERDRRQLFTNLNFSLSEGEILRVVGPNGSGKTTLFRIICGLFDGFEGTLSWFGAPIAKVLPEYLDELLYVGHAGGVKNSLTTEENLKFLAALKDQDVSPDDIWAALEKVGLRGFEESYCGALSAGQKKRVNLARLYLIRSRLWVLDEPFSSIDVEGVKHLEQRIEQHLDSGGMVLLTTHQALDIHYEVKSINVATGEFI